MVVSGSYLFRRLTLSILVRQMSAASTKPAWCSKLPRPQYSTLEHVPIASQRWFQVYRVHPKVFAIYEPYHWEEVISYLVVGSTRSLLIDTGMGIGNIQQVIDTLIPRSTSLQVINTHTHHDHIGDNWRFSGALWGVRSDFSQQNACGSIEEAQNELQPGMIWEKYLPVNFNPKTYRIHPFQIDKYVQDGDSIDLGENQQLKVISTPGHTPDSISLYDAQERLLFVGDTFYLGPILLYRPETNLQDYLGSLEKLAKLSDMVDWILPAHNVPKVAPQFLNRAVQAMRDVMEGRGEPKETDDGKYDEYSYDDFSFVIDRSLL